MFPRPELLASFAAVRRNKENNTHLSEHRQIKRSRCSDTSTFARYQRLLATHAAKPPQNRRFSCSRPQGFGRNVRQHSQDPRV